MHFDLSNLNCELSYVARLAVTSCTGEIPEIYPTSYQKSNRVSGSSIYGNMDSCSDAGSSDEERSSDEESKYTCAVKP